MDSLYEHVHDDDDPIPGSAGVTNNFSWLTRAGEDKIAPQRRYRTMNDVSRRTNRTLDPLEHLPPELSTFVIAQALPPLDITLLPSMYPSRLIELTTVSKKWQSFLFSTPVLWSELYIDERQEDFLATLSVFVGLSNNAPVKLFLCGEPTGIDWTGLASILLPAAERVTCLDFGIGSDDDFEWVPNALSNLLERLSRLPRLKKVNFDTDDKEEVSLSQIKTFGLPSTVKFNGLFRIKLSESCSDSGTRSRFFDVTKCNTSGTLVSLSRPNLLPFEYGTQFDKSVVISNGATLLQLERLAERLAECTCFEQVMHMATFTLYRLQVVIDLSQTEDLLDCLRMLMHLQVLELKIEWWGGKITRRHTLSDTARLNLRILELGLDDGVEHQDEAQKPLDDLFLALGILYPGVEEAHLRGSTWMDFEMFYLQSLRAPKSLILEFEYYPFAPPSESITLQSVQRLEMRGIARLDGMSTPNLLSLVLQPGRDVPKLDHVSPFPRGLRSLKITLHHGMGDFNLTSLDCSDLRDLCLRSWPSRFSWGRPWLSNLVSIEVGSVLHSFTDFSSNQLCITLLCYPWRLPSLRQLHFTNCVEWDVLFLMLKRRNCDKSGVQRIDTVTLPFIPFAFHTLLTRLLVGEIVELPSLISLSLEATREVLFDPSVPGCFACLKNMRPGCVAGVTAGAGVLDEDGFSTPIEYSYPPDDPVTEEAPQEIRDWLSQRWELVEMWKASYKEFALNFARESICVDFIYAQEGA